MTTAVCEQLTIRPPLAHATRRDLSSFMRKACRDAGATGYMVLDTASDANSGGARIIVSDWVFDAIQSAGLEAVAQLGDASVCTYVGATPRGWPVAALSVMLKRERLGTLREFGYETIFSMRIHAGRQHFCALISADVAGRVDVGALRRLQVACGHVMSNLEEALAQPPRDPLSERERECLFWVSEGKTTAEVAVILDVSSNTINSYVAHAIHKLSARNRAMAIATAIRRGIV